METQSLSNFLVTSKNSQNANADLTMQLSNVNNENPKTNISSSDNSSSDDSSSSSSSKLSSKAIRVRTDDEDYFVLPQNACFEAIVSQFQKYIPYVLCVEDGVQMKWYPECGPFPKPLEFEHKQKRNGIVEYYFRYMPNSDHETSMCVFGRDNAEIFSTSYVDDVNTESDNVSDEIDQQASEGSSEILSEDDIKSFQSQGYINKQKEPSYNIISNNDIDNIDEADDISPTISSYIENKDHTSLSKESYQIEIPINTKRNIKEEIYQLH